MANESIAQPTSAECYCGNTVHTLSHDRVRWEPAVSTAIASRAKTTLVSIVVAVLYAVLTNFRMLTASGWTPSSFRGLGHGDQLSYFAIVMNVAAGRSPDTEPFTETGVSHYPRAYYVLLGKIARLTSAPPEIVWWIVGTVLQMGLVFLIAWALVRFTGRLWLAVLAPLPLIAGTFATFFANDWHWSLDSHAVIWGAFAPLYTLNGEAAGLVVAGSFFLLAVAYALLGKNVAVRNTVFIVGGLAIGALANVQTYTFFTSVFLVAYTAAVFGIFRTRAIAIGVVSVAMIPLVYIAGPVIATEFGPLVALASGLIPAAPGIFILLVKWTTRTLLPLLAIALAASPTLVATALGIRDEDPFLTYRTASSSDLGVQLIPAVVGGLTVLVLVTVVLSYGLAHRQHLLTSLAIGPLVVWGLLSTNDIWGANQEPYRFWIDGFVIASIVLFPVATYALSQWARESATANNPATWPTRVKVVGVAVLIVYAISLVDFANFSRSIPRSIPLDDPRSAALVHIAHAAEGETVVLDKCVDGKIYKAVTGSPVAIFNYGMAWPVKSELFTALELSMFKGPLDTEIMRELGLSLILAEDGCKNTWKFGLESRLTLVDHTSFNGGGYTLYRLTN
jgi:hypothetical protein